MFVCLVVFEWFLDDVFLCFFWFFSVLFQGFIEFSGVFCCELLVMFGPTANLQRVRCWDVSWIGFCRIWCFFFSFFWLYPNEKKQHVPVEPNKVMKRALHRVAKGDERVHVNHFPVAQNQRKKKG